MWYLYSGISGKGVSIGFTPLTMLNLIKSINYVTTPDGKHRLCRDTDFDLDYGWVFYRKKESPTQILFKHKWYSITKNINEFEQNNFFIKSYPWEYEKEFRIVIHNKTSTPYDKLVINIDSVNDDIKIKLAPEFTQETLESIRLGYPGFKSIKQSNFQHSKLSINMNLCARNYDNFLEYIKISTMSDMGNNNIDYNKICELICDHCKHGGTNS